MYDRLLLLCKVLVTVCICITRIQCISNRPRKVEVSETLVKVKLGEDAAEVTCSADCSPYNCTFKWDTEPLTEGDTLQITNAEKSDSRDYTCIVSDETGTGNASFTLTVEYGPDEIDVTDSNIEVLLGRNSTIVTCSADCAPPCTFDWGSSHGNNASLRILNAKKSDSGIYICTAENDIGSHTVPCVVDVVYAPDDIQLNTTSKVNLLREESTSFKCEADCNPECQYRWEKDLKPESNTNMLRITYADQKDIGKYDCRAQNVYGVEYSESVRVTVYGAPNTPQNVRISKRTAVSLTIRWNIGWDGNATQKYYVTYDTGDVNTVEVNIGAEEYEISNLDSSRNYILNMYAENDFGKSDDTITVGNTKALPSRYNLFKVTAHDTFMNALLTFEHPQSVTDVSIRCCIYGNDDSCTTVTRQTYGSYHVSLNVTYPEGGKGVYDVMATMYDDNTRVQEFIQPRVKDDSVNSGNHNALITTSVFMAVFACVSIVLAVFILWEKRILILPNKKDNGCDSKSGDSCDYENTDTAHQLSADEYEITSRDEEHSNYCNVGTGVHNPNKAKPKENTPHDNRPGENECYYNLGSNEDTKGQVFTIANVYQGESQDTLQPDLSKHTSIATEYANVRFLGDGQNILQLEQDTAPTITKGNPVSSPKPKLHTKPKTTQQKINGYEKVTKNNAGHNIDIHVYTAMKGKQ